MTRRSTLRGAERTPLGGRGRADVLICGASFAGLATARALASSGADVLVVDRYDIGERATSACAIPTPWVRALGLEGAVRQELECMAFHTPHGSHRFRLPWSWSSFDYRELCLALWEQCGDARFEVTTVTGRSGRVVASDRGPLEAEHIVDALGWRRMLGAQTVQPPEATISRGLEVHPHGTGTDLDVWIDRSLVRYGYAWAVPADGEMRVGAGSYEPRHTSAKAPSRPPPASACRRSASRATTSRTGCAPRSRTASSSPATAPATASRCRARASAPPCTSAMPPGASWRRCSPAGARRWPRDGATQRSPRCTGRPSRRPTDCSG